MKTRPVEQHIELIRHERKWYWMRFSRNRYPIASCARAYKSHQAALIAVKRIFPDIPVYELELDDRTKLKDRDEADDIDDELDDERDETDDTASDNTLEPEDPSTEPTTENDKSEEKDSSSDSDDEMDNPSF